MSIQFQSNQFRDILIYSEVDIIYENQVPEGLRGQAAQEALKQLKTSFKTYKSNLKLTYDQFLNGVETHFKTLNNETKVRQRSRSAVAANLESLATRRIKEEESKFSWIYKLFHRIGQLFKGHGFRTKGEWGLELASRMKMQNSESYKTLLDNAIFGSGFGLNAASPTTSEIEILLKYRPNELSQAEFREVLRDVIFAKKETGFLGDKNKLIFFEKLNEEKREIFYQELFAREDWYEQAFDIIECSDDEKFDTIITSNMLVKFQENLNKYVQQKNRNGWGKRFFYIMIARTVQYYLAQGSIEGYLAIYRLLMSDVFAIEAKEVIKCLSEEEKAQLRKNVNLTSDYQRDYPPGNSPLDSPL